MHRLRLASLILIGLMLTQASAYAIPITLEFNPLDQTVELGDQVSVNVVATTGVDDIFGIVGAFDMVVHWDPALLSLADIVFGTGLGDPNFFESFTDVIPSIDNVFVAQLSLLFDFTGLQDGSPLTLFTLTFDTLGVGTSVLDLSNIIIGDFFGDPFDPIAGTGLVTIIDRAIAVPEPATLLLFATGLLGLGATRKRII